MKMSSLTSAAERHRRNRGEEAIVRDTGMETRLLAVVNQSLGPRNERDQTAPKILASYYHD